MISVILPCLNELRHGYLPRIVENLQGQQDDHEVIAVVTEGQDGTLEFLRSQPHIRVLPSKARNRAQRLNEGLTASQGEEILLHHPATLLPPQVALLEVQQALADPTVAWGGFRHKFDWNHWLLRYTSWYSTQVRPRWSGILYLDHCIFARRSHLVAIGGVPDMDIFEDTVLSQRLAQYGKPHILNGTITTSARRYRTRGVYRHAIVNQTLKACYHLRMDPQWLNRLYEQSTQINVTYPTPEASQHQKSF